MKRAAAGIGLMWASLMLGACSFAPQHPAGWTPDSDTGEAQPPPPSDIPAEAPAGTPAPPDATPKGEPKSALGNPDSYTALGQTYHVLPDSAGFSERGYASWYGPTFQGKKTSSGERYDMYKMTAAHRTLPIPCYARVTNLENGKSIVVRINDRGPFKRGRVLDLSYAAACRLDMVQDGQALVQIDVVNSDGSPTQLAAAGTAEDTPAPAATVSGRFLQAGTFQDAINAVTLREKLLQLGVQMVELRSDMHDGRYVYRVLVGPFADNTTLENTRGVLAGLQLSAIPVDN